MKLSKKFYNTLSRAKEVSSDLRYINELVMVKISRMNLDPIVLKVEDILAQTYRYPNLGQEGFIFYARVSKGYNCTLAKFDFALKPFP